MWIGVVTMCSLLTGDCIPYTMSEDGQMPILFTTEEECIAAGTAPDRQQNLSIRTWRSLGIPPSPTVAAIACDPAELEAMS